MYIFQLHGTANITGHHLFHFDAVRPRTSINLRNTFLGATVCIRKIIPFVHLAAHYLEILDITDVRLNSRLKEIQRSRSVGIRFHHFSTCIVHRRHFIHERNHIAQEFHQTANAHILTCADTEYREHSTGGQTFTDALTHFVFRQ